VIQKRLELRNLVEAQNGKFDKLWEGFLQLGYVDINELGPAEPLHKEVAIYRINEELKKLNDFLKSIYADKRRDLVAAFWAYVFFLICINTLIAFFIITALPHTFLVGALVFY
jgi:hypothetical protein